MQSLIGKVLKNRYEIQDQLGSGAMGIVYRAVDRKTGELVAVKTMSPEIAQDERYRKRFVREAASLRRLNHPNIVGYVDTFSLGEGAVLVMDYYGGGTVEALVKGSQIGLPDGQFKRLALMIADAVASAHENGVVHRDLKPANILLSADGQPKVADFGLAKNQQLSTMTKTGTVMGTLVYMPPEAFDALAKQDARGDIWALGVIFFEMLTRSLPFRGRSDSQIIAAILNDPPMSLYHFRKDIPSAWVNIIDHCLEKEPSFRYQTVRELYNDLEADMASFAFSDSGSSLQSYINLLDDRLGGAPETTSPDYDDHTEILSGQVMPSEPPKKQDDYEYAFITGNEPPAERITAKPPSIDPRTGKKQRSIRDIPHVAGDAPDPKRQKAAGMYIFGGMMGWIGLLLLLGSSFFNLYAFLDETIETPAAARIMLMGTGALFLLIGIGLEIPEADQLNRLMLGSLAFGGIVIAFGGSLAALSGIFFFAAGGALMSVTLLLMYLGVKGF